MKTSSKTLAGIFQEEDIQRKRMKKKVSAKSLAEKYGISKY